MNSKINTNREYWKKMTLIMQGARGQCANRRRVLIKHRGLTARGIY